MQEETKRAVLMLFPFDVDFAAAVVVAGVLAPEGLVGLADEVPVAVPPR